MNNANSWVEICKKSLEKNVHSFLSILKNNSNFLPIVKSNAYGHGLEIIVEILYSIGIKNFGVNSIEEASVIFQKYLDVTILIMGETKNLENRKDEFNSSNLSIAVSRMEEIEVLTNLPKKPRIHLKVDTGMGRLGINQFEEFNNILKFCKNKNMIISGVMTHFASTEDFEDYSYTLFQLDEFKKYYKLAENTLKYKIIKHASASASTLLLSESHLDQVRIGISLYGLWPSPLTKKNIKISENKNLDLNPILSWKSSIVYLKTVEKNSFIGYGSSFKTERKTVVAVIPVGYFEGIDRKLSNNGYFLIKGHRAKIIGRICMNMTMLDVTDFAEMVSLHEEVVIIGKSENETISADDHANFANTINYEIVSRIHGAIPRIVI